ncbi:MAG: hypothetical protein E7583_02385 [Ruminococcaceae bacterium]|nr:hypothetical protein [Oscillospiraceae bacterium]
MTKRSALIFASAALAIGLGIGAVAASVVKDIKAQLRPDFTIVIDGKKQNFKNVKGEKVYPILYEGTTYLPVRAIGELMGKTVYWYEDEKRIELTDKQAATVTDADVIVPGDIGKPKKEQPEKDAPIKDKDTVQQELIGEERAKKIALEYAGLSEKDVIFERTELDRDDGIVKYEISFKQGRTEYDVDIHAYDGRILSFEKDIDD